MQSAHVEAKEMLEEDYGITLTRWSLWLAIDKCMANLFHKEHLLKPTGPQDLPRVAIGISSRKHIRVLAVFAASTLRNSNPTAPSVAREPPSSPTHSEAFSWDVHALMRYKAWDGSQGLYKVEGRTYY